ncbi:MAG: transketolase [Parcubacteria group bacterium Gr01-1014_30]|nr:MAG: transketolase [Parcubacteria group bacterium Gr01-1014_30]
METLDKLARKNKKIIVVICDVGFNYLDNPKLKFKVINFGVTEPTAAIISAALALEGYSVWFYSMLNFVTFRVHEQIRNAICMHKAPVKIIGVKGSEKYKFLGFSHNLLWETEEIEWLKKLPGMKTYLPKNNKAVKKAVLEAYKSKNPCYIRL